MKKIPSIFKRNPDNMNDILNEINPICQWVFDGEGVAKRKYDGSCVKIENGAYFKRRMIKPRKKFPESFFLEDFDPITKKHFGWVNVNWNDPSDNWHVEAYEENLPDGTYELLGPKIQGNPEKSDKHILVKHSDAQLYIDVPRSFEGLIEWFKGRDIEGIVFHHHDGRMAKIKKSDFKLER